MRERGCGSKKRGGARNPLHRQGLMRLGAATTTKGRTLVHQGHALIIEDELLVGLDLQSMLAAMGFTSFAFAATAEQAKEQARLKTPDLITADLGLMSGDGVTAVMSIIEDGFRPSVVFVSGDRTGLERLRGWARVEKPITPTALSQAVDQAMVRGEAEALG